MKVDYSELVNALQSERGSDANRLLEQLLPRLCRYLEVVMDAEPEDARDAVQQALLNTHEKIMGDEIEDKQYIFKYILTACRHAYLRHIRNDDRYQGSLEDYSELMVAPTQQIINLLNEDRQRVLEECLQKLEDEPRKFITYVISNPKATTKGISERFDLSEINVRVKKSRIISDLSYCVKKKWEE